jgi:hypothetical protein
MDWPVRRRSRGSTELFFFQQEKFNELGPANVPMNDGTARERLNPHESLSCIKAVYSCALYKTTALMQDRVR